MFPEPMNDDSLKMRPDYGGGHTFNDRIEEVIKKVGDDVYLALRLSSRKYHYDYNPQNKSLIIFTPDFVYLYRYTMTDSMIKYWKTSLESEYPSLLTDFVSSNEPIFKLNGTRYRFIFDMFKDLFLSLESEGSVDYALCQEACFIAKHFGCNDSVVEEMNSMISSYFQKLTRQPEAAYLDDTLRNSIVYDSSYLAMVNKIYEY